MGEALSGYSRLPGRELGRPGGRGAAMPRNQGGAELGARPDDTTPFLLKRLEFLQIHAVPDRPRAALRARQVRSAGARGNPAAAPRVSTRQIFFDRSQLDHRPPARQIDSKITFTAPPARCAGQAHAEMSF